jgi:hypothetical protein
MKTGVIWGMVYETEDKLGMVYETGDIYEEWYMKTGDIWGMV